MAQSRSLEVVTGGDHLEIADEPVVGSRRATLLPDPSPRDRRYTIISVDDHLVEPPNMFEGRMPQRLVDRAPKVVTTTDGGEAWLYDGKLLPNVGFNAVAGRPPEETGWEPTRFEEMRRGAWDPHERVRDMDINGVYASLNFPSYLTGFGGGRLQTVTDDLDLALATVRAWNDWQFEGWAGSHPDRLIPCQIPWLHDPTVAAEEVRRNAERGYHALTFPEAPSRLGLPSIFSDHWEPLLRACEETGTVVCLHVGSGGALATSSTPEDAPKDVTVVLFNFMAIETAAEWLFSGHPARLPDLKVCLSEGGIGWVPGFMDCVEMMVRRGSREGTWNDWGIDPQEVLQRNFWFCFLDDPRALQLRHEIGIDRIMFEVDYPHDATSWPDTQESVHRQLSDLPAEDVDRLLWKNASELFRHPVPSSVQQDPNAY